MILAITARGTLTDADAIPAPGPSTVPLVLLHAFPLDHRMWAPVAAALPDLPLLLVDLPGAGLSPVVAPTLAQAATEVAATLKKLRFRRFVVAGVSMGGYVAMALARSHPDALAGVALIDTKSTPDDDAAKANRLEIARRVLADDSVASLAGMADNLVGPTTKRERPEVLARVREWIAQSDPAGVAWAQTAMAGRPDSGRSLGWLRVPTAVIVGEEDQLSPPAGARAMAAAIPGAELTVIPGAGHLTPVERPDAVAAALRRLYQRI
jgi:pimeloyl-ACP methyl ester carboxylesterase